MHRRFIALVLSASLAITTVGAAPARAGDTEKWIAGAVGLAILGYAISEENKKKKRQRRAHQQHYYDQDQTHYHNGRAHSHKNGHGAHSHSTTRGHAGPVIIKPKQHGNLVNNRHKRLPAACRVTKQVHGQKIRGFARGCLKRSNVNVRALPQQCKYKIITPNGNQRVIFGSRCLRDRGYRVARAN